MGHAIEIKRRGLILQPNLNDTGPMTAFHEARPGPLEEIGFLLGTGLNKFSKRAADDLLEWRVNQIGKDAVNGANPAVHGDGHQNVVEGVD